jgi:hypothetical protein
MSGAGMTGLEEFGVYDLNEGSAGSGTGGNQSNPGGTGGNQSNTSASIQGILKTIRQRESGGDYSAQAPGSSASGAYQFINSTWRSLTKKYGIGAEFARAVDAPSSIQDSVASKYVEDILARAGGDVSKVPLEWYTGNINGKMSDKAVALNGGLTASEYQRKWMTDYSKIATPGARNGGIFKGPTTGYNVELHGEEAVVPLNRGNHVSKQTLPVGIGGDSSSESNQRMVSLLQTIVDQNSTVISLLDNSNDYSRKLVNVMS